MGIYTRRRGVAHDSLLALRRQWRSGPARGEGESKRRATRRSGAATQQQQQQKRDISQKTSWKKINKEFFGPYLSMRELSAAAVEFMRSDKYFKICISPFFRFPFVTRMGATVCVIIQPHYYKDSLASSSEDRKNRLYKKGRHSDVPRKKKIKEELKMLCVCIII